MRSTHVLIAIVVGAVALTRNVCDAQSTKNASIGIESRHPHRGAVSATGPWYVTTTGLDSNDCLSPGSPCGTINAAIAKASAGDTVYVAAGTYLGVGNEVVRIGKNVTLSGGWNAAFDAAVARSVLDGEAIRLGLLVDAPATTTVERFVIRNGHLFNGSGVRNLGDLRLSECCVEDNIGGFGIGGIANLGVLTLDSTVVRNNLGGAGIYEVGASDGITVNASLITHNDGAGIAAGGAVTVDRSVVSLNVGMGIEYKGDGTLRLSRSSIEFNQAGISNFTGVVLVDGCTIRGNTVPGFITNFGGIRNLSGNGHIGTVELTNTTVSGNGPSYSGGGIFSSGALVANNCTITGNSAEADGGGIYLQFGPGFSSVSLQNCIVAGNSVNYGFGARDCGGGSFTTYPSGGHNLIGNIQFSPLVPVASDLVGVAPLLGPLQDNGGRTLTHALLSGSPAIDAANPAPPGSGPGTCEPIDQRGVERPVGGASDIGAFEVGSIIDCNANGVLDALDVDEGSSSDCDGNRAPDECQRDSDLDGTIDVCEAPAECWLLAGRAAGNASVTVGGVEFRTQLDAVTETWEVTKQNGPSFALPARAPANGGLWRIDRPLVMSVEVVSYDPDRFPLDPNRWSERLDIYAAPNEDPIVFWNGTLNGIHIYYDVSTGDDGKAYLRFYFTIDGM